MKAPVLFDFASKYFNRVFDAVDLVIEREHGVQVHCRSLLPTSKCEPRDPSKLTGAKKAKTDSVAAGSDEPHNVDETLPKATSVIAA